MTKKTAIITVSLLLIGGAFIAFGVLRDET